MKKVLYFIAGAIFCITFTFVCIFAYFFCSPVDVDTDMGCGYYHKTWFDAMDVGFSYKQPGGVIYKGYDNWDNIVIEGVMLFDYDKNWIIASQYEENFGAQYWIIDKHNDKKFGPYRYDDYVLKRQELNISDKLNLQSEEKTSEPLFSWLQSHLEKDLYLGSGIYYIPQKKSSDSLPDKKDGITEASLVIGDVSISNVTQLKYNIDFITAEQALNEGEYHYYIIYTTETKKIFGPYNHENFLDMCKNLSVHEKLIIAQ